jgi:bacillithiol system protein YtxJ
VIRTIREVLSRWLGNNNDRDKKAQSKGGAVFKQIETVDAILEASQGAKVMVLKHSTTCPISDRARREVESLMAEKTETAVYLVVVQQQRDISNEIEEKLGVRHESPQLLLIQDGSVTQHWSHHQITHESAAEALN